MLRKWIFSKNIHKTSLKHRLFRYLYKRICDSQVSTFDFKRMFYNNIHRVLFMNTNWLLWIFNMSNKRVNVNLSMYTCYISSRLLLVFAIVHDNSFSLTSFKHFLSDLTLFYYILQNNHSVTLSSSRSYKRKCNWGATIASFFHVVYKTTCC